MHFIMIHWQWQDSKLTDVIDKLIFQYCSVDKKKPWPLNGLSNEVELLKKKTAKPKQI